MNSNKIKKPFKHKKPFLNNGFRKPMPQEPRSHISHSQPPTAAKRQNTNLDFTQPPPELRKNSANTQSLESILKGKVIKEFLPQVQKEQKAPKLVKIAYEPANSKPPAPLPTLKPPPLVPAPRYLVQQPHLTRQPQQQPYKQQPPIRPQQQPSRPPRWGGFSLKRQFTETAIHQSGFSPNTHISGRLTEWSFHRKGGFLSLGLYTECTIL